MFNVQTTNTEELAETPEIIIYPNPTTGKIYLSNNNLIERYSVTDLSGKLILDGTSLMDGVEVASIPNGMYLISIQSSMG